MNAFAVESDPRQKTLIDELIAEQRTLTAIDRFARRHEHKALPTQSRYYRDLIPLTRPEPGQQYAFEVDLDKCSGCKACVTACHALNGLDDGESWRSVGLLQGVVRESRPNTTTDQRRVTEPSTKTRPHGSTFVQLAVTASCHHCVDPACLNGCPVLAYEKDPATGIVRHLDDQCIGCQYCVMMCPYDAPKYSERLGIVRKCDMCHSRLESDEAPACVQACPNEAIRISTVDVAEVSARFRRSAGNDSPAKSPGFQVEANSFLAATVDPAITVPTTRYHTTHEHAGTLSAADAGSLRPAEPHLPLVFMLVLSQLSIGSLWFGLLPGVNNEAGLRMTVLGSLVAMVLAMTVGSLHLGQPLKMWRAFLGWRRSWFSREVIGFGAYAGLLVILAAVLQAGHKGIVINTLAGVTAFTGLVAVLSSVMIYAATQRPHWSFGSTSVRFLGTTVVLGIEASLFGVAAAHGGESAPGVVEQLLLALAAVVTMVKLVNEFGVLRDHDETNPSPLWKTALLLLGALRPVMNARIIFSLGGGALLPLVILVGAVPASAGIAALMLAMSALGEWLERYLFFAAVTPPKMPGGVPP